MGIESHCWGAAPREAGGLFNLLDHFAEQDRIMT